MCGSPACTDTVTSCKMECGFRPEARRRIAEFIQAGWSDRKIIDNFVAEFGPRVYRDLPSPYGRLVPYLATLCGMLAIVFFIRRLRATPAVAGGPDLARYQAQIERDLANLD
ncbi:MAG: hypothetical protein ACRD8O_04160 [Bryobacteraceae bacterium]